jgi:RHS repeat-associated protein
MLVPNRYGSSSSYRYGFNGKQNDNEIMGEGNFQDYGMRMYNPRIGRFFNVDPLTKKFPELTPYQFSSNTPIWAIDLDGLEAYFSNEGVFQKWGKDKSATAQVVVDNKVLALNVSQVIDRAHWNYGEGGGTMPDQLANALNNRSKMIGEEKMYGGMTTRSKSSVENPITPSNQKQIYLEQSKVVKGEIVNPNYKDFKRLIKTTDGIDLEPEAKLPMDEFKIGEIKKVFASTIKVLSGNLKDDLAGAGYWASGKYGESASLNDSKLGSTITKVQQTTVYNYDSTHWFYNFKKPKEAGNTKQYIEEIKLEKPTFTKKKKG